MEDFLKLSLKKYPVGSIWQFGKEYMSPKRIIGEISKGVPGIIHIEVNGKISEAIQTRFS